jgi:hypothetical protein
LISPHEPKNIYIADETGFFGGHYQQNHSRLREKMSKERLTVLLCENMVVGEMEKPLVIGEATKPRFFKKLKNPFS